MVKRISVQNCEPLGATKLVLTRVSWLKNGENHERECFFSTKLVQTSRKPANDNQNIEKCAKYCVK